MLFMSVAFAISSPTVLNCAIAVCSCGLAIGTSVLISVGSPHLQPSTGLVNENALPGCITKSWLGAYPAVFVLRQAQHERPNSHAFNPRPVPPELVEGGTASAQ